MNFEIVKGNSEDIDEIYHMIYELAVHEGRPEDFKVSKDVLAQKLFVDHAADVLLAKTDHGEVIGMCLYYPIFQTFSAAERYYIEDLIVKKDARGQGIGKAFFKEVSKRAAKNHLAGLKWTCLSDNDTGIAFYEKLGAKKNPEQVAFLLDIDSL